MGERVGILNGGRVEQLDTPENVYSFPRSRFVANFVGSGLFLPGQIREAGWAHTPAGVVPLKKSAFAGEVDVYLPEGGIKLSRHPMPPTCLKGRVVEKYFRGEGCRYDIKAAGRVFAHLLCLEDFSVGEDVFIGVRERTAGVPFHSER